MNKMVDLFTGLSNVCYTKGGNPMENTIDLNMSFDFDTSQFDGPALRNLVHT